MAQQLHRGGPWRPTLATLRSEGALVVDHDVQGAAADTAEQVLLPPHSGPTAAATAAAAAAAQQQPHDDQGAAATTAAAGAAAAATTGAEAVPDPQAPMPGSDSGGTSSDSGGTSSGGPHRFRPSDTLDFRCFESWACGGKQHQLRRQHSQATEHYRGVVIHRLRRRELLKLLNHNRMELLKKIDAAPPGGTTSDDDGDHHNPTTAAAAAAAAAMCGRSPRPREARVEGGGGGGSSLSGLRASSSLDDILLTAKTSGSLGGDQQRRLGDRPGISRGRHAQLRDLRLLDGRNRHRPVIWVRHGVLLVCVEQVRCAIMRQRLLLFSTPAGGDPADFAQRLSSALPPGECSPFRILYQIPPQGLTDPFRGAGRHQRRGGAAAAI
jgi:hypothetical protein